MPLPATNDLHDIQSQMVSLRQQVQDVGKKVDLKSNRITGSLHHIHETLDILTDSIKSLIDAQKAVKNEIDEKQLYAIKNYKTLKAYVEAQTLYVMERDKTLETKLNTILNAINQKAHVQLPQNTSDLNDSQFLDFSRSLLDEPTAVNRAQEEDVPENEPFEELQETDGNLGHVNEGDSTDVADDEQSGELEGNGMDETAVVEGEHGLDKADENDVEPDEPDESTIVGKFDPPRSLDEQLSQESDGDTEDTEVDEVEEGPLVKFDTADPKVLVQTVDEMETNPPLVRSNNCLGIMSEEDRAAIESYLQETEVEPVVDDEIDTNPPLVRSNNCQGILSEENRAAVESFLQETKEEPVVVHQPVDGNSTDANETSAVESLAHDVSVVESVADQSSAMADCTADLVLHLSESEHSTLIGGEPNESLIGGNTLTLGDSIQSDVNSQVCFISF